MRFLNILSLLISLFFTAQAVAHEFEKFPWLVKVQSSYQDEASPAHSMTFTGHGFIVEFMGNDYVVTASHLSQGGRAQEHPNLSIQVFDSKTKRFRSLNYVLRVAKNRSDVEVIELAPGQNVEAIGPWQNQAQLPPELQALYPIGRPTLARKWVQQPQDDGTLLHADGFVSLGVYSFLPQVSQLTTPFRSPLEGLSDNQIRHAYQATNSFFIRNQIDVGFDIAANEILSDTEIHAGMSGLPLFATQKGSDTNIVLAGVVSASSRAFTESWFSLVDSFFQTMAGLQNAPAQGSLQGSFLIGDSLWRCRDGLLYRDGVSPQFQDLVTGQVRQFDFQEVAFARQAAGSGSRSDGGSGSRSDGGSGSRSDGGSGSRSDGGFASGSKLPSDLRPGILFYNQGQAPERAVAFLVHWNAKDYLLPGELSSVTWLLGELEAGRLSADQINPVRPQEDLSEIIWNYFSQTFGTQVRLRMDTISPLAQANSTPVSAKVRRTAQGLQVSLDLGFDELNFTIAKSAEFQPEIQVQGRSSKHTYRVDVSSFLMVSPSVHSFESDLLPPEMRQALPNPMIRFLIKDGEREFLIWNE